MILLDEAEVILGARLFLGEREKMGNGEADGGRCPELEIG